MTDAVPRRVLCGLLFFPVLLLAGPNGRRAAAFQEGVLELGDRLELFVDQQRIESLSGAVLRLHPPRRMERVLETAEPWEGKDCAYFTVFQDGELYRMYYRGQGATPAEVTCYAESRDGIVWVKPALGLFEFAGSKQNNIVWMGTPAGTSHNFAPFKDSRPGVAEDQRYKALAGQPPYAFASPDGIHWRLLADQPVLTQGAFDSQNLAFWDAARNKYVSYYRIFTDEIRGIATSTSDDFLQWTPPEPLNLGDGPREHLYTNAIAPYFRAPHYYFGFPKRFVPDRKRIPEEADAGLSDALFLSSRDGLRFDRTFPEAMLRPGRDRLNWTDRSTMTAWGILPTAEDEMSCYFSQHYGHPTHHLRRGVWRLDGIASAQAPAAGGELISKPLRFAGRRLLLNFATSAAGSVQVEIQDAAGAPIPNFTLADAAVIYGDEIAGAAAWKGSEDASALTGQPIRLRFVLKDCDLYSYRFGD